MIRNMANLLEGFEAYDKEINITSKSSTIRYYTFNDSQKNCYIAIWNDDAAKDNYNYVESDIIIPNIEAKRIQVIDPYNLINQELNFEAHNNTVVINKLLLRDYPVFIKVIE
ncbi:hypothetical protein [Vallitalea maricola]|uniref:Uncharacterized protein n=1 Tax=Vallitalea maricola TaxID=3074433 RepID=A0ACB5UFU9_9FIRM|nr:hypothetical protein AN2V17_06530 [Vallitalea sp. AN17-2]